MAAMNSILNLSKTIKIPITKQLINFKTFKFPAGENHIILQDQITTDKVTIVSSMRNSDDIMTVLLATDAVKRSKFDVKINLVIPYFPYSRQDRVINKGEPLSAKVMANLINSCEYEKVMVFDNHSDVSSCLLNNAHIINNHKFVIKAIDNLIGSTKLSPDGLYEVANDICIVSPDAGAQKKIYEVCKYLGFVQNKNIIFGSKNRDVRTGEIISTDFIGDVNGKLCFIIDDIIDGGTTFTRLGEILKERGALKIYLIASHGIFSKGTNIFKTSIDGIYTTDSITSNEYLNDETGYVRIMNLMNCTKELFN